MAEGGLVSDNSAASVEYEAVKGVNLKNYDRFKHLLSWDEKQSLFEWKGGLEELRKFSKERDFNNKCEQMCQFFKKTRLP